MGKTVVEDFGRVDLEIEGRFLKIYRYYLWQADPQNYDNLSTRERAIVWKHPYSFKKKLSISSCTSFLRVADIVPIIANIDPPPLLILTGMAPRNSDNDFNASDDEMDFDVDNSSSAR